MYTKETIFFDLRRDMRTTGGDDLFGKGVVAGETNFVLYGPYANLPEGQWTVIVKGEIAPNGRCFVDAAGGGGNRALGQVDWAAGDCSFDIDCPLPIEGFEIRVNVARGTFVRIDEVRVERRIESHEARAFAVWDRMGLSLFLDRTSLVDHAIIEFGAWDQEHLDYLTQQATVYAADARDMVFLDIGSYFGLYAMMMAKIGLFERVVAFEADALNFRQLCANLCLNDRACGIEPRNIAVSDVPGETIFASSWKHPEGNRGGVGVTPGTIADGDKSIVPTDTIDRMVPLEGRRIFAKIDVEGHELKVLAGMRDMLSRNRMFLQVETFFQLAEVRALFEGLGYVMVHRIGDDYFFTNFPSDPA